MQALTNLPYPIFLALTASIGAVVALYLTETIWLAVLSVGVGFPLAYLWAKRNLRRMNLPANTTAVQYFAAKRSAPPK